MIAKSIYKQFYQKLILATSLFIIILAFVFYGYTKATIYEEIKEQLLWDAQLIYNISSTSDINYKTDFNLLQGFGITVDLVVEENLNALQYKEYRLNDNFFLELLFPFDLKQNQFLKITKNINSSRAMIQKIFNNLFLLIFLGLFMVILYAFAVSRTLLKPIIQISKKLSKMNENVLTEIDSSTLPKEFHPLAHSINRLTNKIQSVMKFKKELFIGAAHELKTPLAVMKLKNEVTLRKQREPSQYEETLKVMISEIDSMNTMISSILDMGRAQGAQFEQPTDIDIIEFIRQKVRDYRMLASKKDIIITVTSNVNRYTILVQPTLLTQIIQNLVQNAIKFTPEGKDIQVHSQREGNTLEIRITDEGVGIDESVDLFAPFKRIGGKPGAGLGLFLVKNAADTLGGEVSLYNRKDGKQGTVASVKLFGEPIKK